ncbi:MAG: galactokinase [Treponema sp.]|jgi:galactokinase|nr:galactokinase [Treponema sp.]
MLDIGHIHRTEYELDADRSESLGKIVIAEVPGRVHYLGEHGEPKAGLFLSSAIDRYIRVAVSLRRDNSLRFFAANLGERKRTTLLNLKYKREDRWANYLKVAVHIFAGLGFPTKGLNFTVAGDIPQQIGLASSSAIEVAAAVALRGFFNAKLSDEALLSKLITAHKAFFGKKDTAVDYAIALFAEENSFLIVDELNLEVTPIKSRSLDNYKILIMDSRVPRMGVEEELMERRQDLKHGLALLARKHSGTSFRNFVTADLIESMGDLPEEIRRRCMHIVQELRRIDEAEEALLKADRPALSKIILHSHESLRDLYEVSCPEIDWLVKRAQELDGVLGSRMTGRGFGGCTYTIIGEQVIEEYKRRLEDYERIFGFHPIIYEIKPAARARLVPV